MSNARQEENYAVKFTHLVNKLDPLIAAYQDKPKIKTLEAEINKIKSSTDSFPKKYLLVLQKVEETHRGTRQRLSNFIGALSSTLKEFLSDNKLVSPSELRKDLYPILDEELNISAKLKAHEGYKAKIEEIDTEKARMQTNFEADNEAANRNYVVYEANQNKLDSEQNEKIKQFELDKKSELDNSSEVFDWRIDLIRTSIDELNDKLFGKGVELTKTQEREFKH